MVHSALRCVSGTSRYTWRTIRPPRPAPSSGGGRAAARGTRRPCSAVMRFPAAGAARTWPGCRPGLSFIGAQWHPLPGAQVPLAHWHKGHISLMRQRLTMRQMMRHLAHWRRDRARRMQSAPRAFPTAVRSLPMRASGENEWENQQRLEPFADGKRFQTPVRTDPQPTNSLIGSPALSTMRMGRPIGVLFTFV